MEKETAFYQEIKKMVEPIVKEAGLLVCQLQNDPNETIEALKKDGTPVTPSDLKVNQLITQGLSKLFPSHEIRSEELASWNPAHSASYAWVIDPIDGTKAFSSKNQDRDQFAISVSLTHCNMPVVGIINAPRKNLFLAASKGGGAFKNNVLIPSPAKTDPEELKILISSGELKLFPEFMEEIQRLKGIPISMASTVLKAALIAAGEYDVYLTRNTIKEVAAGKEIKYSTSEWDYCASELIVEEAGGILTDRMGQKMIYGKTDPRNYRGILAARTKEIHERVLKILSIQ